jgi:hypothetical protein
MNNNFSILLLLTFFCLNVDARDNLISFNSIAKNISTTGLPTEENEKEINEGIINNPPQKKSNPLIDGALKSQQNLIKEGVIVDPKILDELSADPLINDGAAANNNSSYEKANSYQSIEVEEPTNIEYRGYSSHFEDLPGGYYDKYIDCGLNEHSIRGRNMTVEEMDKMCEEIKKKEREKNFLYFIIILGSVVGVIIIVRTIKKSLKPGIEFQKMAVAFNGVYGVLEDLQSNIESYHPDEIRNEILYCAYISQKNIIKPLDTYNWNELTPIIVPLISEKTINVKIALKKTVDTIKKLAEEMNLHKETYEIFSEGNLFYQFDREQTKNN